MYRNLFHRIYADQGVIDATRFCKARQPPFHIFTPEVQEVLTKAYVNFTDEHHLYLSSLLCFRQNYVSQHLSYEGEGFN